MDFEFNWDKKGAAQLEQFVVSSNELIYLYLNKLLVFARQMDTQGRVAKQDKIKETTESILILILTLVQRGRKNESKEQVARLSWVGCRGTWKTVEPWQMSCCEDKGMKGKELELRPILIRGPTVAQLRLVSQTPRERLK